MRQPGGTNRGMKARKTSRRVRGMAPRDILSLRVSEMPFAVFLGVILQNAEDYKSSYKIHISGL